MTELPIQFVLLGATMGAFTLLIMFGMFWRQDRQRDYRFRMEQLAKEDARRAKEQERLEAAEDRARWEQDDQKQREEEREIGQAAGAGTGGYIVLDLPDDQRRFFHDLLKGFEDYAKLKGYSVSFSIDATFDKRIAFKFTVQEGTLNIGQERVRSDFKEYLDKIKSAESIDDLPVVVSMEEHELLVTLLKNRINFLQHSYNLAKNTSQYYEALMRKATSMPVFPSQQILLQTGGTLDSRGYQSTNSSRLIQGDQNVLTDQSVDASIRIANSFNQRRAQIDALQKLISALKLEEQSKEASEAIRPIERAKEELEEEENPDKSRIARWLSRAKEALQLGSVTREALDAARSAVAVTRCTQSPNTPLNTDTRVRAARAGYRKR